MNAVSAQMPENPTRTDSGAKPFVSIVIPCRNEAAFIGPCLKSVLATSFPQERLEVLVADGMSDDGTRAIISELARQNPIIRLLDNPAKITPCALNVGIGAARGDIIMRMDAHTTYPPNYVGDLVEWLLKSGADNVGGIWRTLPASESTLARAIARGLSHPFGVGNAYFRTGTKEPRWVDTVPFGCYRREVFTRIGMFDPELVRNQDDEFNLRLIRAGGKILLVPSVASDYYARDSLAKLARMYFQYGYFKPLVVRKVGAVMTIRQAVPAILVGGIGLGILLSPWLHVARLLLLLIVCAYATALMGVSATIALRDGVAAGGATGVVFAVLHFSYGLGELAGIAKLLLGHFGLDLFRGEVPLSR
jgi:glycosyltransferase involved in cell wall biosynthesis